MTSPNANDNKASPNVKSPKTLWAQRANKVFLTIELEDCKNPIVELENNKLFFKGKSDSIQAGADHGEHQVTIEFYKPINAAESKHETRARGTEFILIKEESAWWPRLLKENTKQHWLKVDFVKWKDEDDSDDELEVPAGMPGMGMGGMPGMGGGGAGDFSEFMKQMQMSGGLEGMGGMPDLDGEDDDEGKGEGSDDDEDEENPPELSG